MNLEKDPNPSAYPQRTRLLNEISRAGHQGYSLPRSSVPETPVEARFARAAAPDLPELSELEVVRHYTRLSQLNYSIDGGMYPLGSCTMKYNPRINEATASLPDFARLHPLTPAPLAQGALKLMYNLENMLAEIAGFARVSLQPAAGAQGEYTGLRMMRACLEARGERRNKILIPDSAHGTNPATATLCGFEVVALKSPAEGTLSFEQVEAASRDGSVAGIMITNPNTTGLFEGRIKDICNILHERGGLIYCDGANMNAMLGLTRPGDAGVDVMHFNMHKTFTTPHGGGGPGCGGVGVSRTLVPFLPGPTVEKHPQHPDRFVLRDDNAQSIGRIKDWYGHFLMMVRAYTYIRELGAEGVRQVGQDAILLANYVRMRLRDHFEVAFDRPCMHEVVLTDKRQQGNGVKTLDMAKRLIDMGLHPPTVYFPLHVPGAMMIEPTETESLESVEGFCQAMIQIAKDAAEPGAGEKHFKNLPQRAPVGRVDETKAAKELVLTWRM